MKRFRFSQKQNYLTSIFVLLSFSLASMSYICQIPTGESVKEPGSHSQSVSLIPDARDTMKRDFISPPSENRPGVFWDWMGGLISKEGITKDLEALSKQGIGGVMVMQMPDQAPWPKLWAFRDYPGKVKVLSDEWFALVNYAIGETDRLGMSFSIFMCPGWSHAGGPWVTSDMGLKKLQATRLEVTGPVKFDQVLPKEKLIERDDIPNPFISFYKDEAVVAIPTPGVNQSIPLDKIIELSSKMNAEGRLRWDVPSGSWTIVRLGIASENGINHPAPLEGTGLECDRMNPKAVKLVFDGMIGRILREARAKGYHSFKAFETDSYEAGFQDYGIDLRKQFKQRRGYDCVPWLPAWLDSKMIINSKELTERFRNDMLWTISELHTERFHGELRRLADENKVIWMTEPYFMIPIDWRTSGARSTMPGTEFWVGNSGQMGPAIDIAALYGLKTVWAEAFTAESYNSAWRNDPLILKPVGDEAFCAGVNQFYMHGFTHNPFNDNIQPGITMGYWGTQLNRHLTWWPYSASWHRYLARCSFMLQQGRPVNDVLAYPPVIDHLPGHVIDAGPYRQVVLNDEALLTRLSVRNGRIVVEGGGDFAALTLTPNLALRPEALQKIHDLVKEGATLIGLRPPAKSPSLENYPACDEKITVLLNEIWGDGGTGVLNERTLGNGRVLATARLTDALNMITAGPDVQFSTKSAEDLNSFNFGHRRDGNIDIYFVCNTGDKVLETTADFRVAGSTPELWDPVTGETETLLNWQEKDRRTVIPLRFEPKQSFFIIFTQGTAVTKSATILPEEISLASIEGSWDVSFDPRWGGPQNIKFSKLEDWISRPEKGIKYYSGTATYKKKFDLSTTSKQTSKLYLDLGTVHNLARVTLNGQDLGTVWCAPWRVEISPGLIKKEGNILTIDIVNTWVNRLIGDEQEPVDVELIEWDYPGRKGSYDVNIPSRGLKDLPDWLIKGEKRPSSGRYTFSSWYFYDKAGPLLPSGLLGPVRIISVLKK